MARLAVVVRDAVWVETVRWGSTIAAVMIAATFSNVPELLAYLIDLYLGKATRQS